MQDINVQEELSEQDIKILNTTDDLVNLTNTLLNADNPTILQFYLSDLKNELGGLLNLSDENSEKEFNDIFEMMAETFKNNLNYGPVKSLLIKKLATQIRDFNNHIASIKVNGIQKYPNTIKTLNETYYKLIPPPRQL